LVGAASDLIELVEQRSLLVNQQLRVTDDVYEQDMRDLQLNLLFNFGGHLRSSLTSNLSNEPRAKV
jgi:hypothetical protein